ncbi:MAG: acyltransferase family protein [Sulfuricurvum sp.]|nr:acyltransferase family protein [Sulfuricurvum sp.]
MNRDLKLDILRVLSMLTVILIHVTAAYENTNTFDSHDINSWILEILNKSLFWCVPIFFMLSGALLLNKSDESISIFYKRRMGKIVIPTLFWSGFFLAYLSIFKDFTLFNIVGSLFKGAPFYHLWFMYAIIGIYIFTPYLRILLANLSLVQIKYLIIIIFIFTIGNNYLANYFDNQSTLFSSFISYLGYFILGYYLYKTKNDFQKHTTSYGILFLMSLITVSIGSIVLKYILHVNIPIIGYYTPFVAFQAIALYLYIITNSREIKLPKLWIHLSLYSFGVYLMHPAFILLSESYMTMDHLVSLPFFYLLVLVGSYTAVYTLSKIKFLKNLV